MERKFRNPALLITVAMLMLVTGGFLAVLQVGISARRGGGIQHGFSFRGAEAKAGTSYFDDLERGSNIIKSKTSAFFDDIFGGGSYGAPEQGSYASAGGGRYRGYSADEIAGKYAPEEDAFEKYYQENYGSGASEYSPASSGYGGGDAGTFYGGGGGGGSSQNTPAGAPASGVRTAAAGPGASAAAAAPRTAPGQGPGTVRLAADSAAPKLYASLPSRGSDRAGYGMPASAGGGDSDRSAYSKTEGKRGGLDAFRGGGAPKDLDGALEGGRAGSAASYNAKMGGGAASAASAGGGSAPAASAAEKVSGGASSGGSSGGGTSDAGVAPPAAAGSGTEDQGDEKAFIPGDFQNGDDSGKPFLEGVVVEKRNGKDARYVTEEEAAVKLEESQLKSGAAGADESPKDREREKRSDQVREPKPPDPENFEELSPERKLELKRRIHGFLKRVERRYGPMEDIFFTPCESGDQLCRDHELTEGYLTLETSNSAELHLGLKYIDERWRRYTVGFTLFDMKDGRRNRPARSR